MILNPRPVCREIAEGLRLRTLHVESELDRPCAVNADVHGPGVGTLLRELAVHHPDVAPSDVIWIEHGGEAVSTVCGIPWQLRLSEVDLDVLELGLVATRGGWRGRGLQRAMMDVFRERVRERGAHLSIIQGIPGFYRQFGFTCALPLEGGLVLEHRQLPAVEHELWVREATPDDLAGLARLYQELDRELDLHAVRSEEIWAYIMRHRRGTETDGEFWVCEDAGTAAGYMFLPRHHFGHELVVAEAVAHRADVALALLGHAVALSHDREAPAVRLSLHDGSTLCRIARSLGARDLGRYAWQVWCPAFERLLDRLRPALTARLCGTPWAEHTGELVLDLYRYALQIEIVEGTIRSVMRVASPGGGHLRAHEDQLLSLVLGHRTVDELAGWHPDFLVRPGARPLLESLFPRLRAFLYPVY